MGLLHKGGKIGPARWASPVRPKLGPGWAIKFWPEKIGPNLARPGRIFFFALKRLFGPTGPVFRTGWAVKILARKNRANFDPARFWPGPTRPDPPDCHLYYSMPPSPTFSIFALKECKSWRTGLKISICPKLRKLPSIFPNLRTLKIKNCDSLKALTVTPSLMFLILVNNPALEDWKEASVTFLNSDSQPIGQLRSYVKLLELKIICCPILSALSDFFAPQKLEISGCELLTALPVPETAVQFTLQ